MLLRPLGSILLLRAWLDRDSVDRDYDSRERRMMGRRERGQGQLFYAFDLDKVVPAKSSSRVTRDTSWRAITAACRTPRRTSIRLSRIRSR